MDAGLTGRTRKGPNGFPLRPMSEGFWYSNAITLTRPVPIVGMLIGYALFFGPPRQSPAEAR